MTPTGATTPPAGARVTDPSPLRSRPTATVVIPCYNYGHFLPQAVASALDQDGVDAEVIVVDDASPDGSVQVARRLAATDPRIRVIEHATNARHIRTYNDGLREATGDYVVLLSADDALAPNAITRAAAVMEADSAVGLVYGPVRVFDDVLPDEPVQEPRQWVTWPGREWASRLCASGINVIRSPEAIVRGSLLQKVGLYDPAHPHAGDLQMWLRIAAVADVAYLPGTIQAYYREHAQNMHSAVFESDRAQGMMTDLQHRLDAFATAVQSFDDGPRLTESVHEALAREAIDLAARAYVWGLTSTWPVDDLVSFARRLDPDVDRTPAGRAFARRRRVGRVVSRKNPLFVARELSLRSDLARDRDRIAMWGLP